MAVHPNSKANLKPGGGRRKGSKNKITKDLKAAYMEAFDKRGGVQGLLDWAKESPDAFYSQISKMLPKDVDVNTDGEIILKVIYEQGKAGADES